MKHIQWLLLLKIITITLADLQITVFPSDKKINQITTYLFTFNIGNTSILPGNATIVFPSPAYSFNSSSGITSCFDSTNSSNLFGCTIINSSAFTFRWTANMSQQIYMSISNIKNPSYVDNYQVSFNFTSNSGANFTTVFGSINSLTPETLSNCSMVFSPTYTNTYSAVTFTIITKSPIPAGGSMQFTFVGYTPASNTSSISVSVANGSAYINSSVSSTLIGAFLLLPMFFSTAVPASTTFVFTLSYLLSPPTTGSSFSITTLTYASTNYQYKIDERSCSITGIIDLPTSSLSVYTSTSTTLRVGAVKANLFMDFKAPASINFQTDTITVQVANSSSQYLLIYTLSGVILSNNITGSALPGSNTTTGIYLPNTPTSSTISSGTATKFSGFFLNTLVSSGSKTVTVQFLRNNVSYSSGTSTIVVFPNILLSASVTPASTLVLTSTTYSFQLQINNPLGVAAAVVITLPTNVTIASGSCVLSASLSVPSSLSSAIACSASGQTINITSISTTVLPANTTITLNVSGITNPSITKATNLFFFQTYYGTNQMINPVDDSTGFSLTMTPSAVTIPNSYFNVSRTDTTNMKYTIYNFTYKVYKSFPNNGIITIVLPTSMIVSTTGTATYSLSSNATNQTVTMSNSTNSTSNNIILKFTTTTLPANTTFTIIINNILNYYSYKPINILLISATSDGFAVQQSNLVAFSLANTLPDTTLTASDSNSNTMNGNSITYSFNIKTPSILYNTDMISIQLLQTNNTNTQLLYSNTPTCKVNNISVSCSKDSINSRLLYVTVGSNITANSTLSVSVTNITLTRSMDQPGSIKINTLQVSGGTNYLISTYTFSPAPNTQPNLINNAKLTINDNGISSQRLNVATSFTLSFQPTNLLIAGDYIVVSIPSSDWTFKGSTVIVTNVSNISSMTGSLCSDTNIFCSNYNNDTNKIRVDDKTGTFPLNSNISFTFPSSVWISTKNWATTYTKLTFNTYTLSNSSIDSSTNSTTNTAAFALACPNTSTYHCKTCNSAGLCQSCYQTGDGVDTTWTFQGYFFRQSTGQCVTACGVQYYNSSNFCQLCTAPCYSCINSSTNSCTKCIAPTVLVNTTCVSSCSAGYFNSSGVCAQCTSPCSTCVNSSTTCQSCNNGSYLNGTSCVANCNGMTGYFADNVTWTCNVCNTNCTNCSITSSNCTSCALDYFFVSGTSGTCTKSCPSGTVKVNSTLCSCDYTKCKTCAIKIDTCTSCDTGLVLLNTSCTTSCGQGYYVSSSVCVACSSNCTNCTSTTCLTCSSSAIHLYNNLCYSVCPTGTLATSTTCVACPQGCSVCTSSTVCTSCVSIYYLQINSDLSTSCVGKCSGSTPLAQGSKCVSVCTPPLVQDSGFCISNSSNSNGNSNSDSSLSSSKVLPMPVTIGLFILATLTLVSKITFKATIVWASLSAFAGICEVLVWFIFIIVASSGGSLSTSGMVVVLIAYIINLVLNIVSFFFFKKYLWSDDKFQTRKNKLRKTKFGLCLTYFFVGLSVLLSHKWMDILFSNLFEINHCIYKVSIVNKLIPINYVRYVSIVASVVAIIGAAIAGYDTQAESTHSIIFMESIDLIIVTIVACIFAIVATKRNPQQYQKTTGLKTNDMEDQLQHDPVEEDINHFQKEEKGGSFRKKYTYSSSIRNTDPRQNPLSKRNHNKNPIGEEFNLTNVPLDNHDDDNNRISLNDTIGMSSGIFRKKRINQSLDVQEINFAEESGQNLMVSKTNNYKNKISNRYGSESDRVKKQKEDSQSKEKQKFKDNIESRLNQQQRSKAKVIGEVDQINTGLISERHGENSDINLKELSKKERKKEKLQVIETSSEECLSNLPEKEREKVGEIKNAISLIKGKKITIDDYLQYLDIIEQEDQDKNSDDYQNNNLTSKFKGRNAANQSTTKKSKNLVKSLRKNDRRERSARYTKDPKIFVHQHDSSVGGADFDEQKEPQQPDFYQTAMRPRNQSQQFEPSELEELRLSYVRVFNNKTDQKLKKSRQNVTQKLLDLLESGDNDQPSLADQFRKGNTLRHVEKDELPPSNLYSTQKMPQKTHPLKISFQTNANRIGANRLQNQDKIQYIQSEGAQIQTAKDEMMGYDNQNTPSHFDEPNQRIQNQKSTNAPSKPKIQETYQLKNNQVVQIQDLEDAYDEFQNPDQEGQPSRLQRYQSDRNLDYDDILLQKKRNEKQKELEKIYLPRLDVNKASKKKKKLPKAINSGRTNQQ